MTPDSRRLACPLLASLRRVCVILLWCMNMVYTLVLGWRGTLFDTPCLRM